MAKKKSKKRTASAYDVNMTPVSSWDDWFNRAGEMVVPMRKYEEDVREYHGLYADPKNAPEIAVRREFGMRHTSDFYVDDPLFPSFVIKDTIKFGALTFVGLFVFALLMSFILARTLPPDSLFYGMFACGATEIPDKIPTALIWGVVGILFIALTMLVPFTLRRRNIISRLNEGAQALKGYLSLIPPKYRNSFCLDAIFDMRASYGVADFQNAINVLDKHIANNANVYIPFVALSDVPYSNSSTAAFATKTYKPGEHDKSNKALPDDIDAHVDTGVDDADKALEELIGLEDVKSQIRRLKNRISFYENGGVKDRMSGNHMIFLGPPGTGKALDNSTPIPVADERGYVPIGDLKVGDFVFDENGKPTEVLGVYPQGIMPAHRVVFNDGSSLVCNQEHIFAVRKTKAHKTGGKFIDMNVHQMLTEGVTRQSGDGNRITKFWVPMNGPLDRAAVDLPLDPYVLGVLIGDGCLVANQQLIVSSNDEFVVAEVARRLGVVAESTSPNNYNWHFVCEDGSMSLRPELESSRVVTLGYMQKTYGLPEVFGKHSYEKRIPEVYFRCSHEQRLLLLQGLMDTDGSVTAGYRMNCTYSTTSEGLRDDVAKLATSLGMRVTVGQHDRGVSRPDARMEYEVFFKCEHERRPDLFLMSAKKARCKTLLEERQAAGVVCNKSYDDLGIATIEPMEHDVPMTCIYVAAESHLYQAGERHIVTHNTTVARIVTKLLFDFGYIQENRIIEVDGDYLKSPYQGQTGERVNAIVDYAMGGVLFIDEAYLLYDQRGGAAAEATGVLLKAMEDKRDNLVMILAGYEDGMERLVASNEGFTSRVRHKIRFTDYDTEALLDIFDFFLGKLSGNWSIEDGCRPILEKLFDDERKSPGFGNARAVRNALDALLDIHADRSTKGENEPGTQTTLTVGDVESYYEMRRKQIADEGHAFLASKHIDESIITLSDLKSRTRDGSADPDADLEKMIGLERVKDEMKQLDAQQAFYGGGQVTGHMAFVGPPGTGKTECARIVTGKLYKMGYIRENRYLSVTGDFLRGSYIGHTGKRTEAVIEYARGMVLFIDEAYLLYSQKHDDSFGAEALGVLVEAMEKYRGDLVVIFAGYTTPMQELFDGNPGVASRVSTVLHFESYTPKQLCKIFQLMAFERGFKVDSKFWQPLANYIAPLTRAEDFGNARFARELCDKIIKAHVIRYGRGEVPEEGKMTLYVDDLLAVVAQ